MHRKSKLLSLCALLAISAADAPARAADAALMMPALWGACFAGREQSFDIVALSKEDRDARLAWALEAGDRTLLRNEASLVLQSSAPEIHRVILELPEIKDGVALQARLSFALSDAKTGENLAAFEKTLWLFPENPFSGMTKWLADLNITLFDPEKTIAALLEKCEAPFETAANLDALAGKNQGMVVVGQGVSFRRHRGLWEALVSLAARGVPVLCLAPAEGDFPVAASDVYTTWPASEMDLRRNSIIAALDKRLDAEAWPPDFKIAASELEIKSGRGAVMAEVVEPGSNAWTWLQMKFGEPGASLLVCCFDIAGKWDATPSARYLFRAMLEKIAKKAP